MYWKSKEEIVSGRLESVSTDLNKSSSWLRKRVEKSIWQQGCLQWPWQNPFWWSWGFESLTGEGLLDDGKRSGEGEWKQLPFRAKRWRWCIADCGLLRARVECCLGLEMGSVTNFQHWISKFSYVMACTVTALWLCCVDSTSIYHMYRTDFILVRLYDNCTSYQLVLC